MMIEDGARSTYRATRQIAIRYFGEVGYLSRQVHRLEAEFRERGRLAERKALVTSRDMMPQARDIAQDLKENGYHITTVAALGLDDSVNSFCRDASANMQDFSLAELAAERDGKSKRYWTNLYEKFGCQRTPAVDFLLSDVVLDICASYLGEVPILNYMALLLTPPQGARVSKNFRASQDWHLDNDRPRRLKIFILPLGADEECGPTMFLSRKRSTQKSYRRYYPGYFDDRQFEIAGLDPSKIVKFTGGPGKLLFIDTSALFHCGSRTATKARLTFTADLAPMTTFLPYRTALRTSWPESFCPQLNAEILARFKR